MKRTRRDFLQASATGIAATFAITSLNYESPQRVRCFHFVQIDVFTSQRLQGNRIVGFPDAHGLTDFELQDINRETNLQETTIVFPRDPADERERGIKARIFIPEEEIPFGGHPTLGTAMVLRNRKLVREKVSRS